MWGIRIQWKKTQFFDIFWYIVCVCHGNHDWFGNPTSWLCCTFWIGVWLSSGKQTIGFVFKMGLIMFVSYDDIFLLLKLDSITFSCFLSLVTELASLKEIHGYIVRNGVPLDAFLKSAFGDLYFNCSIVEMAYKIFNLSITIDLVMCTAMISG